MSAIKIPSKRIYNNEHSLAKNQISKVDAKISKLDFEKDFDATVASLQRDMSSVYNDYSDVYKNDIQSNHLQTAVDGWDIVDVRLRRTPPNEQVSFPIVTNNGKTKIVSLSEDPTSYSLSATKRTVVYSFTYDDNFAAELDGDDYFILPTEAQIQEKYPNIKPIQETIVDVASIPNKFEHDHASVDFGSNESFTTTLDNENLVCSYSNIRVYADAITGYVKHYSNSGAAPNYARWREIIFEKYMPKEFSFSVKGNIEVYKENSRNEQYGDDGEDYYSIETNELMLDVATINGVPATQAIAENIIDGFKDGKETYSLVCSIGDYYDEDGALAISTKTQVRGKNKMMFDIGDTVIPYKPSASGDVVISSSANGTYPKMFKVVGVTPIFDGASWQKLDLLETNTMEKNVIVEALEERTETVVQLLPPRVGLYTTTMNISVPSNVDFVKINGERISSEKEIEDRTEIDDKNSYYTYASFVDGVLSIRTLVSSTDVSVIKNPSDVEEGEFLYEFAEVPEREYLFELHMS